MEASEVASISTVVLTKLEDELVTGFKLRPDMSVVFTRPGETSEVTGVGEEGLLPANVGEIGEGEVVAEMGPTDGDLVFSTGELIRDTSLELLLIVVISACPKPQGTDNGVPSKEAVVDLAKESAPSDVAPERSIWVLKGTFVDNVKRGEVESLFLDSEEMSEDLVDVAEAGMNDSSKEVTSVLEA